MMIVIDGDGCDDDSDRSAFQAFVGLYKDDSLSVKKSVSDLLVKFIVNPYDVKLTSGLNFPFFEKYLPYFNSK